MIPLKADLSFNEILNPPSTNCKSGHVAPAGTRMWSISGDTLPKERWGVYCDKCLEVAGKLAQANDKDILKEAEKL